MRYSAKQFLDFIFESHHDVPEIWQMKSDVTFFISNMIKMLGGDFVSEFKIENQFGITPENGVKLKKYQLNGKTFGLLNIPNKMHRTQYFILADPADIDDIFRTWETEVEIEDNKRVFTLKRRAINGNLFQDVFAQSIQSGYTQDMIKNTLKRALGIQDMVARKFQFGWRATQKTKRVATSKPVLTEQEEWREVMEFGGEFASSLEMLKNGTLAFKIPVWAVEPRNQNSPQPRKMYGDKNLDYVGRFVIGRKDSVIRWWDFYTNTSRRIEWRPGSHLTSLEHYKDALKRLASIMERGEYIETRENKRTVFLFPRFKFKNGWTDNTLDLSRVDQQISKALDDLW